MLKKPNNLREKLLSMNVISMIAAFLLILLVIFVRDLIQIKEHISSDLSSKCKLIANNTSAALSFDDKVAAAETLSSLKHNPNIKQAIIFDKQGAIFTRFAPANYNTQLPQIRKIKDVKYTFRSIDMFDEITINKELVGSIYIQYDTLSFYKSIVVEILALLLITLASLLISSTLFSRLQKQITDPISDIIETMHRVSEEKDYTLRVEGQAEYEIEILKNEFNSMLGELQKNNVVIENHKTDLEHQIQERTNELKLSNSSLEEELIHRKETEAIILSKSDDLKQALQAEKRFLATMSHEMRTPLNAIIGFVEVLLASDMSKHDNKLLNIVSGSSKHLHNLICDVLDVSKIDSGQMEIRLSNFDLIKTITECITIVKSRVSKNVNFIVDIPMFDFSVIGDPLRIRQIFLNILGNSAKFTEKGEIRFKCHICEQSENSRVNLEFLITDTGPGIKQENIKHLFKPFKQLGSTKEGTGLGLFISKALAKLMKGDIIVQNQKPSGLKTIVSLEFEKKPLLVESTNIREDSEYGIEDFKDLNILLVDDLDVNLLVAREIFNKFFGITTLDIAMNGEIAVKMAQETTYDIIFMDIQMPIMNGIEATIQLRKLDVTVPIIAMSADAFLEQINRAKDAGMNDYITKPIASKDIYRAFQNYLDKKYHDNNQLEIKNITSTLTEAKPIKISEDKDENFKEIMYSFFLKTFENKETANELVSTSIESIHNCFAEMEESIKAKNSDDALKAFHKFYGLLLNSNLKNAAKIFMNIRTLAKEQQDFDKISDEYTKFMEYFKSKLNFDSTSQ